jgi:hypothetical protein
VALPERRGSDHDGFARNSFGREFSAFYRGLYGGDRKTAKSKAIRDQGLGLLLGHGTGSRVSRHSLDVIDKSARLLSLLRFSGGFPEAGPSFMQKKLKAVPGPRLVG